MTITIDPKSLEEIEQMKMERLKEQLLEEGEHEFTVNEAHEMMSKKGDPMLKLVLGVKHNEKKYVIFDYVLCTNTWMFKLRALCASLGLLEMYESGSIEASKIRGKKGFAYFSLENDKTYGWKSKVDGYIILTEKEKSTERKQNTEIKDDDIPF